MSDEANEGLSIEVRGISAARPNEAPFDNRARSPREKFDEIEKKRRAADVGMVELCGVANVSRETWRRIDRGMVEPRPSTLRKLRRGLDRLLAETIDPRR